MLPLSSKEIVAQELKQGVTNKGGTASPLALWGGEDFLFLLCVIASAEGAKQSPRN